MIRSLYTAATGMIAQQLNLDVIANNLANVNTTGFKKGRADFQDLMYQVIEEPGTAANQSGTSPTGIQVGLGARPAAVGKIINEVWRSWTTGDFGRLGITPRSAPYPSTCSTQTPYLPDEYVGAGSSPGSYRPPPPG